MRYKCQRSSRYGECNSRASRLQDNLAAQTWAFFDVDRVNNEQRLTTSFYSTLVSKLFSTPPLLLMLSCMYNCQTSGNSEIEKIQQKNDDVLHGVEDLKV